MIKTIIIMKRITISLALLICAIFFVLSCNSNKKTDDQEGENQESIENVEGEEGEAQDGKEQVENKLAFNPDSVAAEPIFDIVTSMGTIRIKLFSDTPKHRDNFVRLASQRFYDGILFHRVINGFMIQAGDPVTKRGDVNPSVFGRTDAGYKLPAEILPEHTHIKGALAAAREGDRANPEKKSSSSQFYLVQNPDACAQLNGSYTVYGQTIGGMEIIDAIAAVKVSDRDCPLTPVKIISVNLVEEK